MKLKKIFRSSVFMGVYIILIFSVPGFSQERKIVMQKKLLFLLADLEVKVRGPDTALAGEDLRDRIKVKIFNNGGTEAKNFMVDLVLSSNTFVPVKIASYSANYSEDVLLKGGREGVQSLPAKDKMMLTLNGSNRIPPDTPPGDYYIGVVVDSGNVVKELNENNNIATYPIKIGPRITDVIQSFSWMIAPVREIEIEGNGFGAVQGTKTLKMGTYNLSVLGGEWHPDHIYCSYPGGVPHGEHYLVSVMDAAQVISNQFDFFLKMILFKTNFDPYQGPAGTELHVDGMMMGASQGQKVLKFGTVNAQIQTWNDANIHCIVPNLPPGDYNVYIEKNGVTISNVVTYTITPN